MKQMDEMIGKMTDVAKKKEATMHLDMSKRKWCYARVMSLLSLKADIRQREWHVRYVPEADIAAVVRFLFLPLNQQ
jgi:hypothetical protein